MLPLVMGVSACSGNKGGINNKGDVINDAFEGDPDNYWNID